jgi:pentapeptide MXKDX repeat protein
MRLCNRSVVLAVPFLLTALAFAGCSSGEPEGGKMDGAMDKGAMQKDAMGGMMEKGKMDGGAMDKGKMDGGAMDKGKMDGSPK